MWCSSGAQISWLIGPASGLRHTTTSSALRSPSSEPARRIASLSYSGTEAIK